MALPVDENGRILPRYPCLDPYQFPRHKVARRERALALLHDIRILYQTSSITDVSPEVLRQIDSAIENLGATIIAIETVKSGVDP